VQGIGLLILGKIVDYAFRLSTSEGDGGSP